MAVCLALLFPEALIFHALFGETYLFIGAMQTVKNRFTSVLTNENMSLPALLVNARRPPMSYEPLTPPPELPTEIVNTLNSCPPEQLRHVAQYAEALAEHKAGEARLEES